MAPPPPPPYQAYPFQKVVDESSQAVFVGDSMARLGRLETQIVQILPVLGRVAEAVDGLGTSLEDLKGDVKDVVNGFGVFKIETATYGGRLAKLETFISTHDTQKLQDVEFARLKAEAVLEQERLKAAAIIEAVDSDKRDRRNRILSIAGTAIASFVVASILYWLKIR